MRNPKNMRRVARVLPWMLLGMGVLYVADWVYTDFERPLKLVNGLAFLLMGVAAMLEHRLAAARPDARGRKAAVVLFLIGLTLAIGVLVQRWL